MRLEGLDAPGWKSLLGRKVSVRYGRPGDEQHPFSEAIGVVQTVREEPPTVTIVNRRGVPATVPIADVTAGKVFPP